MQCRYLLVTVFFWFWGGAVVAQQMIKISSDPIDLAKLEMRTWLEGCTFQKTLDSVPNEVRIEMQRQLAEVSTETFLKTLKLMAVVVVDSLTKPRGYFGSSPVYDKGHAIYNYYDIFYETKLNNSTSCLFHVFFSKEGQLLRKSDLPELMALLPKVISYSKVLDTLRKQGYTTINAVSKVEMFFLPMQSDIVYRITELPDEDAIVKKRLIANACTGVYLGQDYRDVISPGKGLIPGNLSPAYLLIPHRYGQKWGYSDSLGRQVLSAKYEAAQLFQEYGKGRAYRRFTYVKQKGKWGIIDDKGKKIVAAEYDTIFTVQGNASVLMKKQGCYFRYRLRTKQLVAVKLTDSKARNELGTFLEEVLMYDYKNKKIPLTSKGFAVTRENSSYPNRTDTAYFNVHDVKQIPFTDTAVFIKTEEGWGIAGFSGRIKTRPQYDSIYYLEDGIFAVKKYGKYALLDTRRDTLSSFMYQEINKNPDFGYVIKRDDKWGCKWYKSEFLIGQERIEYFKPVNDGLIQVFAPHNRLLGYAFRNGLVYWKD